jgi:hypothetical protein
MVGSEQGKGGTPIFRMLKETQLDALRLTLTHNTFDSSTLIRV